MTSRSTSRSRKPIAGTCPTLTFTCSTPVISHWTRLQMRSPHWFEALSVLQVEDSWHGTLAEACAGYLTHLFTKSEGYASTMALISHLAFTKRCTCEETQEQASSCSMNIHAPTHQPSREVTYSLRLWKETQKHPLTLTRPFCSAERTSSVLCKRTCQGLCCSLIVVV